MANEIETVIRIMERTPGHRSPIPGAPTHCPDCGEWGLVDHADQHEWTTHCYRCGAEWTLTRRAVAALANNVTFVPSPPTGALFDAEPIPLRSRLAHPSNTPSSAGILDLDAQDGDTGPARRPRLRLAFSNGRRVHPAGA